MPFALINTANNAVVSIDTIKLCDTWHSCDIKINIYTTTFARTNTQCGIYKHGNML